MKKRKNKNLLSLTKRKIASLNNIYGGNDDETGGDTSYSTIPIPETYEMVCEDGSDVYVLKKKEKKEKGPVLGNPSN